jgi:hypothetical protein
MISEKIIKDRFIIDTLRQKTEELKRVQLQILSAADEDVRKKFDIPAIEAAVTNLNGVITGSNANIMYSQRIVKKLRFLDMKKFGNLKVYNSKTWGYFYGEIAAELKYGFSQEVKAAIRQQLQAAINP